LSLEIRRVVSRTEASVATVYLQNCSLKINPWLQSKVQKKYENI
jgi:hypothetical protein